MTTVSIPVAVTREWRARTDAAAAELADRRNNFTRSSLIEGKTYTLRIGDTVQVDDHVGVTLRDTQRGPRFQGVYRYNTNNPWYPAPGTFAAAGSAVTAAREKWLEVGPNSTFTPEGG